MPGLASAGGFLEIQHLGAAFFLSLHIAIATLTRHNSPTATVADRVVSCLPAASEGVRNALNELRVMVREAQNFKYPHPTLTMVPLSNRHSIDEEEGQRSNSVSVNTRGPLYNKY